MSAVQAAAHSLAELQELGWLGPLDRHLAAALGRVGGESRPEVLLAAALAARQVEEGHVCLDLHRFLETARGGPGELVWPAGSPWLEALRESPLVDDTPGRARGARPLVLDGAGRLYLRRYWSHERSLARALGARAKLVDPVDETSLRALLDRLLPGRGEASAGPRIAASVAAVRRLCVISGGPGAGKTTAAATVLAVQVELARAASQPDPRILLAAPTGKAASRLGEAIEGAKARLDCDASVREALPAEARTLHHALGARPDGRFRRGADDPLPFDVVLVDEASMVDLPLMASLVDALLPSARLLLLGDPDQLASVEAGAVLADLCGEQPGQPSRAFARRLTALSGERVQAAPGTPPAVADCLVALSHSHRYGAASGIGALARAVRAGDADAALAVLEDPAFTDVAREELPGGAALTGALGEAVLAGYRPLLEAAEPAEQLERLGDFRVLCPLRRGAWGVEAMLAAVARLLVAEGLLEPAEPAHDDLLPGRPVLVTRNAPRLGLWNGDVGILARESGSQRVRAFFPRPGHAPLALAPSRLPPHEIAFAMSVHKSQGSEFGRVALLLPEHADPFASRELLYTGVTRAREQVVVHGSRSAIAAAIGRRAERASGLREALWGRARAPEQQSLFDDALPGGAAPPGGEAS